MTDPMDDAASQRPHEPPCCTAVAKATGERCRRAPICGGTVCSKHGGSAPQVRAAAERSLAAIRVNNIVAKWGIPDDVMPAEWLAAELRRAAGAVAYLDAKVAGIDDDDLAFGLAKLERIPMMTDGGVLTVDKRTFEAKPSVWYQLWVEARKHATAVARDAHAAGIVEERIRIDRAQAELFAAEVRGFLSAVGVDLHDPTTVAAFDRFIDRLDALERGEAPATPVHGGGQGLPDPW